MIQEQDLTVVIQGDVRRNTRRVLLSLRRQVPQAQLIFSTFANEVQAAERAGIERLVDRICLTDDPGPLPPTVNSRTAPLNNINRMLRSTQWGLSRVNTAFALKLRSDAECNVKAVLNGWMSAVGNQDLAACERLAFASHYTRHPHGINGYLFHVSDWMTFGRSQTVASYWAAPRFTAEDALWFETHPRPAKLSATARRFKAVFSQEQWLCIHYAKAKGYQTPTGIYDRSAGLVSEYLQFLATECVILDVEAIEMHVPNQAWARRSTFQDLDCVSHLDWLALSGRAAADPRRERKRALARLCRHQIAHAVLFKRWIDRRWSNPTGRQPGIADTTNAVPPE